MLLGNINVNSLKIFEIPGRPGPADQAVERKRKEKLADKAPTRPTWNSGRNHHHEVPKKFRVDSEGGC